MSVDEGTRALGREVLSSVEREGPLTGAELVERTRAEPLPLWRACRSSADVRFEVVGRPFLRLDRAVEGYARLSPSIWREFLTYTLLGATRLPGPLAERAARLGEEIAAISRFKLDLARAAMESVVQELPERAAILEDVCFLIAGDVTYGMAHRVPRPERSTGKLVRGSDLDVIVIASDELPQAALQALDDAIHRRKHYLLVHPDYREEIDYVVKRMARVRQQLAFDTFKAMVACKIMHEGQHLYGSAVVFRSVKEQVARSGVPARIAALAQRATGMRLLAEKSLLEREPGDSGPDYRVLFHTREEGDEIF